MSEGHLEPADDSPAVPEAVTNLIQDLDASWNKKFEALTGLLKRKLGSDDGENDSPAKTQRLGQDDSESDLGQSGDFLEIREEGELDDLEEKEAQLLSSSKKDETDSDDENTSLLKKIAAELSASEETVGKRVRDDLADIVDGRFANKLSPDLQKKKFEQYNRPENCTKLIVPTVNSEIWSKLSSDAIKNDLKLQHIQRAVIKAATACVLAADELLAPPSQSTASSDAVMHMTNAVAILGHASREISLRRRSAIRPHVNKPFSRICDESVPITDKLFGDSLSNTLKDVRETDRISASVSASPSERRFNRGASRYQGFRNHGTGSQFPHSDSGRARGHFLGRGNKSRRQQWAHQKRGYQNPNSQ